MKFLTHTLVLAALILSLGQISQAAPVTGGITLANCGNDPGCPAATYSFSIGSNTASLTIHITGGVTASNNEIGSVDLGFTSLTLAGLTGTGPATANGTWLFSQDPVSNAGCNANSNAKFACAKITPNAQSNGVTIANGGTYMWTWSWTNALTAADIFAIGNVHIGANYNPANGLIVSRTGATSGGTGPGVPTPEPSTLVFLGSGLLGVVGFARRRRMR